MTGDEQPGPDFRVSHADRDQVVEILREAAGDGRLSADELDERVEAALAARSGSDLAVLTADLPVTAAVVPPAVRCPRRTPGQWIRGESAL